MTDTRDARKQCEAMFAPPFAAMLCESMGRTAEMARPGMKATARANLEALSLAGHRARAYADLPRTIASCRTPFDLVEAQMRFWQTAMRDYQESAQRMTAVWQVALSGKGEDAGEARQRDYFTFGETEADSRNAQRRGSERHAA